MKKKVVLFISELIPGGAIKQIIELSRFLQEDYEVILITWFEYPNEHYEIPSKVQRYFLANSEPNKRDIITVIKKIRDTRNFLKQINPDVTISFLHEINAWNILSSLGLEKTKKIISVREYPKYNAKNFRSLIYKFLSNYASVLVCQTSEIKEWLVENNYRSEIVVIPNSISQNIKPDLTKSNLQTVEGAYILAIGTSVFQKGFDLLLKAYDGAVLKGLKIPLRIVGLGITEEYRELVKLKNELQPEASVTVTWLAPALSWLACVPDSPDDH
jgi:glycosyltransferase involved in cell wall biosynthesis